MFRNKILLITGGTGTFGNAVLKRFLKTDIKEIRIFSQMKRNSMKCAMHCGEAHCQEGFLKIFLQNLVAHHF